MEKPPLPVPRLGDDAVWCACEEALEWLRAVERDRLADERYPNMSGVNP